MTESADDVTPAEEAGETRSAAQIRADIAQTREQMGDTIEALAEKTDVKTQARRRVQSAEETVTEHLGTWPATVGGKADDFATRARQATPESRGVALERVIASVRERPLPFAAAAGLTAGLLIGWLMGRG